MSLVAPFGLLSRFSKSLIAAVALHAILAMRWATSSPKPLASRNAVAAAELQIELVQTPALANVVSASSSETDTAIHSRPSPMPPSGDDSVKPSLSQTRTAASASPHAVSEGPPASMDEVGEALASNTTLPLPNSEPSPTRRIDLGLDGHMFRVAPSEATAARAKKSRNHLTLERDLNNSLKASLVAADVESGHGRGNVFIEPLRSAVRTAGPIQGDAIFRITVNSLGEVSELELLRGSAGDWSRAIQSFREQARRRRAQLPVGANGLRMTFNVSTHLQMPSGKRVDAPSIGVRTPSLAANGMTFRGNFDVADASSGAIQMVHARVVHEEVL